MISCAFRICVGDFNCVDVRLQLVYEDLIDRAKEKEEKEAKKRKRLAKDFTDKLSSIKVYEMCLRVEGLYCSCFYQLFSHKLIQFSFICHFYLLNRRK